MADSENGQRERAGLDRPIKRGACHTEKQGRLLHAQKGSVRFDLRIASHLDSPVSSRARRCAVVAVHPPNGHHPERHLPDWGDVTLGPHHLREAVTFVGGVCGVGPDRSCVRPLLARCGHLEPCGQTLIPLTRIRRRSQLGAVVRYMPIARVADSLNYCRGLCRRIIVRASSNTLTGVMKCGAHNVSGTVLKH